MVTRDPIPKWIAYFALLIAIAALNYSVLGYLPISLPLLLPLAAAAAGLLEHSLFGAGFGMAAGILLSAVGHSSPAAIPLLALLGWICGWLGQSVLQPNLLWFLVLSALSMLLRELWQVGVRLLSGSVGFAPLFRIALWEFLWTLAFAVPIYYLFGLCHRRWRNE